MAFAFARNSLFVIAAAGAEDFVALPPPQPTTPRLSVSVAAIAIIPGRPGRRAPLAETVGLLENSLVIGLLQML
jgi:hypothetical protein